MSQAGPPCPPPPRGRKSHRCSRCQGGPCAPQIGICLSPVVFPTPVMQTPSQSTALLSLQLAQPSLYKQNSAHRWSLMPGAACGSFLGVTVFLLNSQRAHPLSPCPPKGTGSISPAFASETLSPSVTSKVTLPNRYTGPPLPGNKTSLFRGIGSPGGPTLPLTLNQKKSQSQYPKSWLSSKVNSLVL